MKSGGISFLQGLSIAMLNPKIFIWFIAIYSQFISIKNDIFLNMSWILMKNIPDTNAHVIMELYK